MIEGGMNRRQLLTGAIAAGAVLVAPEKAAATMDSKSEHIDLRGVLEYVFTQDPISAKIIRELKAGGKFTNFKDAISQTVAEVAHQQKCSLGAALAKKEFITGAAALVASTKINNTPVFTPEELKKLSAVLEKIKKKATEQLQIAT